MSIDDLAEAAEQRDRDLCLSLRKPELPKTGKCHNCEDPTSGAFCCYECGKDYETRTSLRNIRVC